MEDFFNLSMVYNKFLTKVRCISLDVFRMILNYVFRIETKPKFCPKFF